MTTEEYFCSEMGNVQGFFLCVWSGGGLKRAVLRFLGQWFVAQRVSVFKPPLWEVALTKEHFLCSVMLHTAMLYLTRLRLSFHWLCWVSTRCKGWTHTVHFPAYIFSWITFCLAWGWLVCVMSEEVVELLCDYYLMAPYRLDGYSLILHVDRS